MVPYLYVYVCVAGDGEEGLTDVITVSARDRSGLAGCPHSWP